MLEINRIQNLFNHLILGPGAFLLGTLLTAKTAYKKFKKNNYIESLNYASIALASMVGLFFVTKFSYLDAIDNLKVENIFHQLMSNISIIISSINNLRKITSDNSQLNKVISISKFKDNSNEKNENLEKMFDILKDENFKTKATWKSTKGKMMASLHYLEELKQELIKPYFDMGKLDAFMSAAKLYKKFKKHPNVNYKFAKYKNQKKPTLAVKNFWNPLINLDKVIPNSVEFNNQNHRNILLTGPNAGGKSTALKAIAYSVLLAQTLTISNANITLTPFSKLFTTLNITDTIGKESLYQADKNRVKKVITELCLLDSENENALVISDEMFNSTGASYGSALFYGSLKYINDELKNTLFIAATHFQNLTELEEDTNQEIANFCMEEAIISKTGKISWPYKIKQGINKQNIAFELAQEDGFDPKLLNASINFLKKHNKN